VRPGAFAGKERSNPVFLVFTVRNDGGFPTGPHRINESLFGEIQKREKQERLKMRVPPIQRINKSVLKKLGKRRKTCLP
jgi:hypothetical protein